MLFNVPASAIGFVAVNGHDHLSTICVTPFLVTAFLADAEQNRSDVKPERPLSPCKPEIGGSRERDFQNLSARQGD